jgi:hypothetical protein
MHSSIAYNRTKSLRERGHVKGHSHFQQYGGVALLSTTQAAHRVSGHGRDSTGLGRWTWTNYQGKGSVSLKVVAAYRPCQSDGALSTYSQHVNYLYEKDDDRCPRQAFLDDLKIELKKWIQAGEQVIVMLDTNGGIRDGTIQQMFFEVAMREVLLELNSELPVTSTFCRNFQDIPIDGVFATPSIHARGGGYFPFGEGPGQDHQCLWMDLSFQNAFGHSPPPMGKPQAKRLTCQDPRIRQRYNDLYRKYVRQHRLDSRSYRLQESVSGPLNPSQIVEYEGISLLRSQGIAYATKHCRKLKMGEVDWNPEIQTLRQRITAWNLLTKKLRKCRVGSKYLRRVIAAADLPSGSYELTLDEAVLAQRANFKAYRIARKSHVESRSTWLKQLADSKSQQGGKAPAKHLKSLISIEKQQRQARNVK